MKKSKTILFILCGVVVLIAAAVFYLFQNLDVIVKKAIETYGSETTGTMVRVRSVEIGLKDGRGTVRGLTVANPPGFSKEDIFSLGEITLDIDTASVTSDLPVIEEIRIGTPAFLFEVDKTAKTNLEAIKKNLRQTAGSRKESRQKSTEGSSEPHLLIKRLIIEGGKGTLDLAAVGGKRLEARTPPVNLTNIGGKQGVTPSALSEVVLAALVKNLEQTAARRGVEQAIRGKLEEESGRLQKKLDEEIAPGAGEAFKKMLGQ